MASCEVLHLRIYLIEAEAIPGQPVGGDGADPQADDARVDGGGADESSLGEIRKGCSYPAFHAKICGCDAAQPGSHVLATVVDPAVVKRAVVAVPFRALFCHLEDAVEPAGRCDYLVPGVDDVVAQTQSQCGESREPEPRADYCGCDDGSRARAWLRAAGFQKRHKPAEQADTC